MDGKDVFATVRENSPSGEVVAELMADTTEEEVQWILDGKDSDWFFLDERHIRLNTSADKVLDREVIPQETSLETRRPKCWGQDHIKRYIVYMCTLISWSV